MGRAGPEPVERTLGGKEMTDQGAGTESILLVAGDDALSRRLAELLAAEPGVGACHRVVGGAVGGGDGQGEGSGQGTGGERETVAEALAARRPGAAVYLAACRGADGFQPDLEDAEACFTALARTGVPRVVVVASAAVNEPSHHHAGHLGEDRLTVRRGVASTGAAAAERWAELEELAARCLGPSGVAPGGTPAATLLRPTAVVIPGGLDPFSRFLSRSVAFTLPGHDPTVQLLAPEELARAVARALAHSRGGGNGGPYNVAPASPIPLRKALRLAGAHRLPVPGWLQGLFSRRRRAWLPYIRYSWTVSGEKIGRELGFSPRSTSAEAALAFAARETERMGRHHADADRPTLHYDDFGQDKDYIALFGSTLFRFAHDFYWRIEVAGTQNIPRQGRAVLVGMHRGFKPWDGVMALHHIVRATGRYPRFLLHPTLVKFPFLFNYMYKLGGIAACQENADWVLQRDEMVGIFPEGIRGAFRFYRDAYRLGKFGRDEYVKMALRNSAPLVPFVTVGSAEIFPIVGRIDWTWFKHFTEWPFLPITTTIPGVPLPSKWHTRYLEPLHVERQHPPEAADDPEVVQAVSAEVRRRMQEAMEDLLARRPAIFWGSAFTAEERARGTAAGEPEAGGGV